MPECLETQTFQVLVNPCWQVWPSSAISSSVHPFTRALCGPCGGHKHSPPKDVYTLIPVTCEYCRLHGKKTLKIWLILCCGKYPGLTRAPSISTSVFIREEESTRVKGGDVIMEAEVRMVLLEGDHKPKNKAKLLESGKGKKQISHWSLWEHVAL